MREQHPFLTMFLAVLVTAVFSTFYLWIFAAEWMFKTLNRLFSQDKLREENPSSEENTHKE